jgi:hypothetical protein
MLHASFMLHVLPGTDDAKLACSPGSRPVVIQVVEIGTVGSMPQAVFFRHRGDLQEKGAVCASGKVGAAGSRSVSLQMPAPPDYINGRIDDQLQER